MKQIWPTRRPWKARSACGELGPGGALARTAYLGLFNLLEKTFRVSQVTPVVKSLLADTRDVKARPGLTLGPKMLEKEVATHPVIFCYGKPHQGQEPGACGHGVACTRFQSLPGCAGSRGSMGRSSLTWESNQGPLPRQPGVLTTVDTMEVLQP